MKVLHLLSTSKWTGPSSYIIDILNFLKENNDEVLIAVRTKPKGNLISFLKKYKIPYTEKLFLYKKFNPIYFFYDLYQLKKIIDYFSPNIVHTHFSPENILISLLKNTNYKSIRSIHNTKSTLNKPFSKIILNKNDFIHTVCNEYKQNLIKYNNIPPSKIKIISGWIDEKKFNPIGKKFFEENSKIKIGMVARFQKKRGHEFLVKAFKKLNKRNTTLILTGRGEYKGEIEALVKKLNIIDQVIFTGYIRERLPDLLRSLDIFVLLEEGSDGTCRAILEAMATGLPIVSVNKGAIKETVKNNINGFLINSKTNIDELCNKLKLLIDNKKLREKFGIKSREIIEKNFTKQNKLKEFYNFYKEII